MGTPRCSICAHSERTKIEALCAGGNSMSAVAKQFGVDRSQLSRHMSGTPNAPAHVTAAEMSAYLCGKTKVEELRLYAAQQTGTVLEDAQLGKAMIFKAMADAATARDVQRLAAVSGRFLDFLQFIGERTGEIARLNPGVYVDAREQHYHEATSPRFLRLQRGLMKLVMDHPGVRADLMAMQAECAAEDRAGKLAEVEVSRAAA